MRRSKLSIASATMLAAALLAQASFVAAAKAKRKARTGVFKVRIENISSPDGQTAKDGTR